MVHKARKRSQSEHTAQGLSSFRGDKGEDVNRPEEKVQGES